MLADREVLRSCYGTDHEAKVRDGKTSGRHVVWDVTSVLSHWDDPD
jgi:hypothetical protein